ncbi:MAG: hypothetical protein J6X53_03365 [Abditibacteriota bacterium]|nr:hypothetical protein [Abditibacteriota bacterium]MBP5718002.1 hypothetical protein [Abditibacteriota bacterium]MBP5738461.1 hypothetical protein [Abditibacteriota bacterium]
MNDKLRNILKAANKETEVFKTSDGSEVLMMSFGGRVLGLFAPGSDENFYWTNTALDSEESAIAAIGDGQFLHTGGDRTWMSPEIDFFMPEFPNRDVYIQPRPLDPGNYKFVREDGKTKMVNELTLTVSRTKKNVDLRITKWLGDAPNPLRYQRGFDLSGIEYAGYTQYATLEMLSDPNESTVGLWNLVQMPFGGDLIIPTYGKSEAKIYFGDIKDKVTSKDGLIVFKMDLQGEHKIGVRATATAGRVGYLYDTGKDGKWAVIIRNFIVNPSGEYIDVPWQDIEEFGYSTQACNVNSALGQFNELEYHIPAIGKGTGRCKCDDQAQVWAFRGSKEKMLSVVKTLLSSVY